MKISTIGGNVAENSGAFAASSTGSRWSPWASRSCCPTARCCGPATSASRTSPGIPCAISSSARKAPALGVITKVLLKPTPGARRRKRPCWPRSPRWTRRRRPCPTSSPRRSFPAPWSSSTAPRSPRGRLREDWAAARLRGPVAHGNRRPPGGGRGGGVADGRDRPEERGALEVRVAQTDEEAAKLASARRTAFSALARAAPTTILEDITVPRSELARMVRFVEGVAQKHGLRVGTFGHMGDGNLHPTFLRTSATPTRCTASRRRSRNCSPRPSGWAARSRVNTGWGWRRRRSSRSSRARPRCG